MGQHVSSLNFSCSTYLKRLHPAIQGCKKLWFLWRQPRNTVSEPLCLTVRMTESSSAPTGSSKLSQSHAFRLKVSLYYFLSSIAWRKRDSSIVTCSQYPQSHSSSLLAWDAWSTARWGIKLLESISRRWFTTSQLLKSCSLFTVSSCSWTISTCSFQLTR